TFGISLALILNQGFFFHFFRTTRNSSYSLILFFTINDAGRMLFIHRRRTRHTEISDGFFAAGNSAGQCPLQIHTAAQYLQR
ncbi:hypothetical protein, partial [Klebsiella pneumoniae]|uniref:hypothetical protein n=1 Tax=Klebsiella pneumoniae TaxID=573 RepID=UPI001CDC1CE1